MGGKRTLQMVQCIVYGWTTNGRNVTVMCGRKEHRLKSVHEREVDYQRWVGSVLSASWWTMKGVRCERKEYVKECEQM